MGYHSKNSGGGSRFSRKTLALVSALGIGASASIFVVNADAAPKPRNESVYSDAEELGRNVIGSEKLEPLKPRVTGGSAPVQQGDKVAYEYQVDTGFPADPANVTAQRWLKLILKQDPKVPFVLGRDGNPTVNGLPAGAKLSAKGENEWEVVLGAEYLDMVEQGAKVNNSKHDQWAKDPEKDTQVWDNKAKPWDPPSSLTLKIPATVKEDADGEFAKGTLQVTSGRLVDVDLSDDKIPFTFESNNSKGECTWNVNYETSLVKKEAGYWVSGVYIAEKIDKKSEEFQALLEAHKKIKPRLIGGTVKVGERTIGKIIPAKSDSFLGELQLQLEQDPLFASNYWMRPADKVTVEYQVTGPCGEKVNEQVVRERTRISYIDSTQPPGLRNDPGVAFVQGSTVQVGISRPPEDASATAEMKFIKPKDVSPAPESKVSLGDKVWFDADRDGLQGGSEPGVEGVTVTLLDEQGDPVMNPDTSAPYVVTTGPDGMYLFKDLPKGKYKVKFDASGAKMPKGVGAEKFVGFTEKSAKSDRAVNLFKDSDVSVDGLTDVIDLQENRLDIDAGLIAEPKPEPEVAKFAVSKVLSETGKKFGNQSLAEQDNGEITVKHLIRVKNISTVAGKSAKVYDTPGTPAGMKIKSVMLADNPVELTAGGYKLSDGVKLTPGAEAGFNVTVVYEPEQIPVGEDPEAAADEDAVEESDKPKVIFKDKATELEKLGVCTPDNGTEYGIDEKLGFYNAVHMEGDADEEKAGNNWDCVSVNPPAEPERPESPINPTPPSPTPEVPTPPAPGEPRTPGFGWLVPLLPLIPFLGGVGSSQGSSAPVVPAPQNSSAPAAPQTVTPVPAPKPGERPQLARTGASVLGLLAVAVLLVVAGLGVMRMRRKEQ
ncbi:hypothetical protein FRC0522_00351 [Corynebacterium diphtheriae]|nr:hypothetical protein FRC0522_00351 [Corynebacterium diphtheriae]